MHASSVLMYLMTIMRVLPALVTYFVIPLFGHRYATVFTIALQWWGKISHAQNWSFFCEASRLFRISSAISASTENGRSRSLSFVLAIEISRR